MNIVGMNNDNSVDGNLSEMDYTVTPQQHIVPEIESDTHNCSRNINTQYVIEEREYRRNYQREYRKRCSEQMNDIERKHQRLI